jgi:hypothetical protein
MPYDTDKRQDHRAVSAVQLWQRAARVRWLAESIDDEAAARKLMEFAEELHVRAMTQNPFDTN